MQMLLEMQLAFKKFPVFFFAENYAEDLQKICALFRVAQKKNRK